MAARQRETGEDSHEWPHFSSSPENFPKTKGAHLTQGARKLHADKGTTRGQGDSRRGGSLRRNQRRRRLERGRCWMLPLSKPLAVRRMPSERRNAPGTSWGGPLGRKNPSDTRIVSKPIVRNPRGPEHLFRGPKCPGAIDTKRTASGRTFPGLCSALRRRAGTWTERMGRRVGVWPIGPRPLW